MKYLWVAVILAGCSGGTSSGTGGGTGGSSGGGSGGSGGGLADSGTADSGSNDSGVIDAGAIDAGVPDAGADGGTSFIPGSRYWDGGSCAVKTDCPCFSSDDCAPSFYCHSENASGADVYCVPGARGDGGLGTPCTGEADCSSALCIEHTSGDRCTVLCENMSECGNGFPKCLYVGFGVDRSICAP